MGSETSEIFSENKWTVQDKLTQLRNMTKLQGDSRGSNGKVKYKNRTAIQNETTAKTTYKKQAEKIKTLSKENSKLRETLDINIKGDDLLRRTTMRKNRAYQRALYHTPTEKIVGHVSEIIFDKTKKLDKLRYEKSEMKKYLLKLKVQLMNSKTASIPVIYDQQEIFNKLQNMSEKQKAALSVKKTYEKMIKLLKNDSQTYDKTLADLEAERTTQSKCILNVTEMGQKASEELANLCDDYKEVELNTFSLMRKMDVTAKSIKSELDRLVASCKTVVRTESATCFECVSIDEDYENPDDLFEALVARDLAELEKVVENLKSVTEVLSVDEIYPRIKNQVHRKIRLFNEISIKDKLRNNLLDQRNQLEALLENLENSMVSSTTWYKEEKARLKSECLRLNEKCSKTSLAIQKTGNFLLSIRTALLALDLKLDRINKSSEFHILRTELEDTSREGVLSTLPSHEVNALVVIRKIRKKMVMLLEKAKKFGDYVLTPIEYTESKIEFEDNIIIKNIIKKEVDLYELAVTEMLEALVTTDDPMVPTRSEIKNQSYNIIKKFTVNVVQTLIDPGFDSKLPEIKEKQTSDKFE